MALILKRVSVSRPSAEWSDQNNSTGNVPLIDQIAVRNAGRVEEEVFEHLLPSWASDSDRLETLNLITAKGISETPETEKWVANGRERARELLRKPASRLTPDTCSSTHESDARRTPPGAPARRFGNGST